jgi:hypothetical protein
MSNIRRKLGLFGMLALAGCTRTDDYVQVVRAHQKAMQDVTAVLAKIQKEDDMAAAREELRESYTRCDALQKKANALPKPPPPEVVDRIDPAGYKQAFDDMVDQVRRVHRLQGGEEFLDSLRAPAR